VGSKQKLGLVCVALAAAGALAAGSAPAAGGVDINACRYEATAPVVAVVRVHDAKGAVAFQRGCRVTLRPSRGGRPVLVLGGVAYPGNQFAGRLQLERTGGEEADDEITRKIITRVSGLSEAYLIREVYRLGGAIDRQVIMVKLGAKMIVLTDLGFPDEKDDRHYLTPKAFAKVARLVR
jgi:hypothetical protein